MMRPQRTFESEAIEAASSSQTAVHEQETPIMEGYPGTVETNCPIGLSDDGASHPL